MAARRRLIPSPPLIHRGSNWRPGSALRWGPGWQGTSARPIPSLPPGLYAGKVTVPLTGGQAQSVVSSGPTYATPALRQSASNTATSGTSLTITLGSATVAGNCLIIKVSASQGTTNPTVSTITLGGSSTNLVKAVQNNVAGFFDTEIWAIWNIAGGQTSVVVTFTAGSGTGQGNLAYAEEWTGLLNTGSPVDVFNSGDATSTAFSSGSSGTLSQASEMIAGVATVGSSTATITGPSSPWTNQSQLSVTNLTMQAGYQVVSSTAAQTYSGTISASVSWNTAIATFKAGTTGSGVSGATAVSVGPQGLGTIWYPAQVVVSTTSSLAGTDNSVCNVYLGSGAVPNTLLGTVVGGGLLGVAVPPLAPGQTLIAQWTGGNPGDVASINVIGTMDALTVLRI